MRTGLTIATTALVGLVLLVGLGCKNKEEGPKGSPDPNAKMKEPPKPPQLPPGGDPNKAK